MAAATEQDWAALDTWLATQGMERSPSASPKQFTGGLANLNYLIEVDGQPVVLRRPPPGPLGEGASDMAREHRVLSRLHEHYPLAPRAIAFCDDHDVLGADFQLIEYRPGVTMSDEPPAGTDPAQLTNGFVEALTKLHGIDVERAGLQDLGRPDGFVRRQIDGWERRAKAAFGEDDTPDTVGHIAVWLRDNQPETGRVSLLHNDFKFDNLIFDPDTSAVVAVIDWDMSTLGDPLFELGVTLSYWADDDDPPAIRGLKQSPSLHDGFPDRASLARAYFEAPDLDPVPLGFYLALARFRLAVAWQQMYVLHQRGALAGDQYASFDRIAVEVLDHTAATLDPDHI
jgi:aminoglycoside phosphotransferase (APT) family kinase protein